MLIRNDDGRPMNRAQSLGVSKPKRPARQALQSDGPTGAKMFEIPRKFGIETPGPLGSGPVPSMTPDESSRQHGSGVYESLLIRSQPPPLTPIRLWSDGR